MQIFHGIFFLSAKDAFRRSKPVVLTSKNAAALIRNLLFADNIVVLNLYFFTMMKIARDERYRDFFLV